VSHERVSAKADPHPLSLFPAGTTCNACGHYLAKDAARPGSGYRWQGLVLCNWCLKHPNTEHPRDMHFEPYTGPKAQDGQADEPAHGAREQAAQAA
jgi:hypothetical protein